MLVSVTADTVRSRLNLTLEDADDDKVNGMIQDAAATIALEVGRSIDYTNCSEAEATAIKNLAAIYLICHLSGGSAAGLNFSVGDLRVDGSDKMPSVEILYRELERLLLRLRYPSVEMT
ncbi:MAG: hypothetical protein ACQXXH_08305 [Candidatus Bathyarchaeia archaeon]|nr:hypothetical protein [Candidatus Bathyarchaeota archaeon A05DMB-4]MDH7596000.1 hypothetical protein [Candidatus Bathyarchaeota archaeon]